MSPIWAVLLVLVAFAIVLRFKGRNRRKLKGPVYSRRIDGFQVVARLEPDMPSACLFDHGVQFGKGFRRKEGPQLPHHGNCHCTTAPFSFTSNEVFNGALRNFAGVQTDYPDLPPDVAGNMAEQIKRAESPQPPQTLEDYLDAVKLGDLGQKNEAAVRRFLTARFEHLQGGGKAIASGQASGTEVAADN